MKVRIDEESFDFDDNKEAQNEQANRIVERTMIQKKLYAIDDHSCIDLSWTEAGIPHLLSATEEWDGTITVHYYGIGGKRTQHEPPASKVNKIILTCWDNI